MQSTREQVAEVIQMARDRALGIKSTCFCHALSANRRPCVACDSYDIIIALCNALQAADNAMENTYKVVQDFSDKMKAVIDAEKNK